MPKTTNLGLELTDDNSTKFKDWREAINGVGEDENKSNMQIIDDAIGVINTQLGDIDTALTDLHTQLGAIDTALTDLHTVFQSILGV